MAQSFEQNVFYGVLNIAIFPVGPFLVPTGGIIVFLGVLAAAFILIRTVRDEEVSLKFLSDHLFYFIVIPFFFGRLGAFLSLWPTVQQQLPPGDFFGSIYEIVRQFFLIGNGTLLSDWAIGGFFVVFFLLAYWHKEKFYSWLDAFILPGIVLAFSFALGGFISGWNYGSPAPEWLPFPLSVQYNLQEVRFSVPIYSVQLYAAVLLAIVFWISWYFWRRKIWRRWRPGKFFMLMLFVLGVTNAFLDFFRGDEAMPIFGVRISLIISIIIALFALFFLVFIIRDKPFLERFHEKGDFSSKI